jgi:type IV secretory pathway TraG/TraD family ATPase VirD4
MVLILLFVESSDPEQWDNCNTKLFMRVPDANTASYVSRHLGEGPIKT